MVVQGEAVGRIGRCKVTGQQTVECSSATAAGTSSVVDSSLAGGSKVLAH